MISSEPPPANIQPSFHARYYGQSVMGDARKVNSPTAMTLTSLEIASILPTISKDLPDE
jgi:hypothetical protein